MSPFMRRRSILHPHILHHKQPQRGPRPAPTSIPIPVVHRGLTLRELQHLKWGMDVQIEEVILKVENNRLNWRWAVLDMKELKLSLDEIQFVAEGGEITWNTETGEDWPAEGKEEEAEHNNNDKEELNLEEPKAKIPTKIFVGTETVDKVDCNTEDIRKSQIQAGICIDVQMQTFLHLSLEDFRKTMGCEIDHWTDEEVNILQDFFKMSKVERDSARRARVMAKAATFANTPLTATSISTPNNQATVSSRGDGSMSTLVLNTTAAAPSIENGGSIQTASASRWMFSNQDSPTYIEKGEHPEPDSISTSIPLYLAPSTYFPKGEDIQIASSSSLIPAPLKLRPGSSAGKGGRVPNGPASDPTSASSLAAVTCAGNGKGKQTESASSSNSIPDPQCVASYIGQGEPLRIGPPSISTSSSQRHTSPINNGTKAINREQVEADIQLLDDEIEMQLETFNSVRAGFTETIKLLDSQIPYTEDEKATVQQVLRGMGADVIAGNPLITEDQKAAAQQVLIDARARLIADMTLLPSSMALNESQGAGEQNEPGAASTSPSGDQALADSRLKEIVEERQRLVEAFAEAEYRTRRLDLRIRAERAQLPASQPDSSASQKVQNSQSVPDVLDSPTASCAVPSLGPNKGGQSQTGTTSTSTSIDQAPDVSSSSAAMETPEFAADTKEQRVLSEAEYREKRLQVQYRAEREKILGHPVGYTPDGIKIPPDVAAIRDVMIKQGYPAPEIGVAYLGTKSQQPGDKARVCQHACRRAIRPKYDLAAERHLSQIIDGQPAASPRHGAGRMMKLDLFGDIYPPQRHLAAISYPTKPVKTDEEAAVEMAEDVECFRQAMRDRKKGVEHVYHEARRCHGMKTDGWKKEDAGLEAEINLRAEQYHLMLIAGRRFEKGETILAGLGPEAQKHLTFMECDEAEQIRRAGHARKIREEYYAQLDQSQTPYDVNDFMEAEMRAFMYNNPEEDPEMPEYHEEYEAAVAAGYVPAEEGAAGFYGTAASAPLEPPACSNAGRHGRRHGMVNNSVEDQIRWRQEAREKQEADRKRMVAERELAKEVKEAKDAVTRGGGGKKSQKKGKGRKHKK